jgi:hypothetical protein
MYYFFIYLHNSSFISIKYPNKYVSRKIYEYLNYSLPPGDASTLFYWTQINFIYKIWQTAAVRLIYWNLYSSWRKKWKLKCQYHYKEVDSTSVIDLAWFFVLFYGERCTCKLIKIICSSLHIHMLCLASLYTIGVFNLTKKSLFFFIEEAHMLRELAKQIVKYNSKLHYQV